MDKNSLIRQRTQNITRQIIAGKKYKNVSPLVVNRIAGEEAIKHRQDKQATKSAKLQLHRIYGSFIRETNYSQAWLKLKEAGKSHNKNLIGTQLKQILGMHASTGERTGFLRSFYRQIFDITGQPSTVLDLGCGLNPLSMICLKMPKEIKWYGLEADEKMVSFVNLLLRQFGYQPLCQTADLAQTQNPPPVDMALLLKMAPVLDSQKKGLALELIKQLKANWLVISLSTKSLGSKTYHNRQDRSQTQLNEIVDRLGQPVKMIDFKNETLAIFSLKEK